LGQQYETTNIHVRAILPDGTTPKIGTFAMNAPLCVLLPVGSSRPTGAGFIGDSSSSGQVLLRDKPFEFSVPVGANVLLVMSNFADYSDASTAAWHSFSAGGGYLTLTAQQPRKSEIKRQQDVYIAPPYTFVPEKENDEIVLQLEKATFVTGTLRYANGEPAIGEGIGVKQFVPAIRGADIPSVRERSVVHVIASTDANGNFELPLWSGEFTLFAGGTLWSEHVTKTFFVEQGKPIEVDLTIPTPLRINVVMPDGSPAGNFRLCQLTTYSPVWNKTSPPEVSFTMLYESRSWATQMWAKEEGGRGLAFVVQEYPIAMNLCTDYENYVTVMTEDNEFGIVRKLDPELMGKELTLTLRPTIAGTVKLIDESKNPIAEQEVSIRMRFLKPERNGGYLEKHAYYAQALCFRTDAEGQGHFKVPIFEGVDDSISLFFQQGGGEQWIAFAHGDRFPGRTLRGWLGGVNYNGKRYSRAGEWFKPFRPDPQGQPFDLGVMEIER
jgi:hypothetical protein